MKIIKKLNRLNEALPGLLLGIIIYGILAEVIGVWFSDDKIRYTSGLIIGLLCSGYMAVNLASVIEDSVLGDSPKMLAFKSVVRYLIVCAVMIGMMYFKLGGLISGILGLLGLKVSAYAQPLLNKVFSKSKKSKEKEVKL